MKLVVLTTDTRHHAWFVRELHSVFQISAVLVEDDIAVPPFKTRHPYEDEQDQYEQRIWFDGSGHGVIDSEADVTHCRRVNEAPALALLRQLEPEVIIVFGTRKLSRDVIAVCPDGLLNLHGGDPEQDRGLDSHLWAIYQDRFEALLTTLHRVNDRFDDGEIILQAPVPLRRGMPLYELRARNTEVCLELTMAGLAIHDRLGRIPSRPQRRCGRYSSFMPADLKDVCRRRFSRFTERLP